MLSFKGLNKKKKQAKGGYKYIMTRVLKEVHEEFLLKEVMYMTVHLKLLVCIKTILNLNHMQCFIYNIF